MSQETEVVRTKIVPERQNLSGTEDLMLRGETGVDPGKFTRRTIDTTKLPDSLDRTVQQTSLANLKKQPGYEAAKCHGDVKAADDVVTALLKRDRIKELKAKLDPDKNDELTHVDLFSGIGGFALAARWTGFRTVAFCECEPYAQRVLRKHWPDVPIHDDVRTFPGASHAGATLLTGGFPCQPFSLAGKRGGAGDDRFLWPAMVAVIEAVWPTWIIGENVPGIVTMELDRCASDLEAQGYAVWPVILPACAVGAFHRRDRVWIVAQREKSGLEGPDATRPARADGRVAKCGGDVADAKGGGGRGRLCEAEPKQNRNQSADGGGTLADSESREGDGRGAGSMGGAAGRGEGVNTTAHAGREDVPNAGRGGGEGARGCERGGSNAAWWEPEPDVGRVATGIPARVDRLRGLGNAIVPQVAAEIMRMIVSIHTQNNAVRVK